MGGQLMKTDRITKVLLGIVSILLLMNLLNSFLSAKSALAVSEDEKKGRYQISAWGTESESAAVPGEVVASKMDVHKR